MTKKELKEISEFSEQAAKIFSLMGWTWVRVGVPNKDDIKRTLTQLVKDVKGNKCIQAKTGRLFARVDEEEWGTIEYGMEFTGLLGLEE